MISLVSLYKSVIRNADGKTSLRIQGSDVFLWLVFSPSVGLGTKFVKVQSLCCNRFFSLLTHLDIFEMSQSCSFVIIINLDIYVEVRADSQK